MPGAFSPLGTRSAQLVGLRVFALGLSFAISLFVARELGAAEFGRFEGWLAWVGLASVAAGLGTDRMVVRFTAAYRDRGDWARLRGLLYGLGAAVLSLALVAAVFGVGALALGLGDRIPGGRPLVLGLVLVSTTVALRFAQAALQGLDRVVWSQVADLVVLPLAFVVTFVVLGRGGGDGPAGVDALASQTVATGFALLTVGVVFAASRPAELRDAPTTLALGAWWGQSWLLLILAFLQIAIARVDVAVFDLVGDDAALGHYAAARRIAAPVVAVVLAVNASVAPEVARLHARGDRAGLQALATRMARWTTVAAAAAGLLLVGLGPFVLAWFGPGFPAAGTALRIMVASQVLNAAAGSVVLLLIMSGNTRRALPGLAVAALVQAGLAWALIPPLGATGAAWATAAGTVTWNLLLAIAVAVHLGVDPTVAGRPPRAPRSDA